jgi:putative spermidine/putrescine transport system ATP-binding protein
VAFGLEMRKIASVEIARRIGEVLRLVRLEHLPGRLPRQLSGGQQQRVALARALVFRPDVLLLDEPLSNLDAKLRQDVRVEIRELQKKLTLTTVMVTHDQEEALTMADRLVVMQDGEVRQVGTQQDLYERPRDRFVASFVGRSTFIEGEIEAPGKFRSAGGLALVCNAAAAGPATLALRPERMLIEAAPLAGVDNNLPGVVEFVSYLGATVDMHVRISAKERVVVQIPNRAGSLVPRVGQHVHVAWLAANGIVFPGVSPSS